MPSPKRRFHKAMTIQKAKLMARGLGLTLREVCSGDYRVNFRDGNESAATRRTSNRPSIPPLRWPANDPFSFLFWRQCDQQQSGFPSLLRLNHRERGRLGFPCRDDAVRDMETREGFAFSSGT